MGHLKYFSICNFKVFQHEETFEFAPITILTGTNSSGKSSLIKSLILLSNSITNNLFFQTLDFNSNRRLGDFQSSVNSKNPFNPNSTIDFCLPITLDYFDGNFFIDLKFEKEEAGLKNNGRLSSIEIYKEELNIKTILFFFSAINRRESKGIMDVTDSFFVRGEVLKEEYESERNFAYIINLEFVFEELTKQKQKVLQNDNAEDSEEKELIRQLLIQEALRQQKDLHETQDKIKQLQDRSNEDMSYKNFLNYTAPFKLQLTNESAESFETIKQNLLSFFKSHLIYTYLDEELSQRIEKEHHLYDTIVEIENRAFSKLSIPNTDLDEFDYMYDILPIFFSDEFIKSFVTLKINQMVEEELEKANKEEIAKLKILSETGRLIVETCFLRNLEKAFKRLRDNLNIKYLGSIRSIQERINSSDTQKNLNNLIEDFIKLEVNKNFSISKFLNYWLSQFEIGEKIDVEMDASGSINVILVHKKGRAINIADLGFGISQIVPIFLQIAINASKYLSSNSPSIICIEEPESNLHPALQSKLADLFIDAADKFKIQFILETHSEYLIRKMQYWVAKKVIGPDAAAIYYFHNPDKIPEGERQIKRIEIKEDGSLSDEFGTGFFDEADKIAISVWNMQNSQKN